MANNYVKYSIAFRNINSKAELVLIEQLENTEYILAICNDANWEKLKQAMPANDAPVFLLKESYSIIETLPQCSIEGGVRS